MFPISSFLNYILGTIILKKNTLMMKKLIIGFANLLIRMKKYSIDIYKDFIVDLQIIVETNYAPLSGALEVKKNSNAKLKKRILEKFKYIDSKIFDQMIPFFTSDYARFLDRIELARLLSKHSINFGIFGKEWPGYPEFRKFVGGHISNEMSYLKFIRNQKLISITIHMV